MYKYASLFLLSVVAGLGLLAACPAASAAPAVQAGAVRVYGPYYSYDDAVETARYWRSQGYKASISAPTDGPWFVHVVWKANA
jgi:hypothetical protein